MNHEKFYTNVDNIYCRKADNTDGSAIRQIIFSVLESYGLGLDPSDTDKDLFDIEFWYPKETFWVLVNEKQEIKGSFALFILSEKKGEVRKMYFHKDIRGFGLGRWAMNFIIAQAKYLSLTELTLETASPLKEALNLYAKMGFKSCDSQIHSGRCDKVMRLVI
jgi:putative acetyltransferase